MALDTIFLKNLCCSSTFCPVRNINVKCPANTVLEEQSDADRSRRNSWLRGDLHHAPARRCQDPNPGAAEGLRRCLHLDSWLLPQNDCERGLLRHLQRHPATHHSRDAQESHQVLHLRAVQKCFWFFAHYICR